MFITYMIPNISFMFITYIIPNINFTFITHVMHTERLICLLHIGFLPKKPWLTKGLRSSYVYCTYNAYRKCIHMFIIYIMFTEKNIIMIYFYFMHRIHILS